jgi:hypothetical protein
MFPIAAVFEVLISRHLIRSTAEKLKIGYPFKVRERDTRLPPFQLSGNKS